MPRDAALTLAGALDRYLEGRKIWDSSAAESRGVIERHAVKRLGSPLSALTADAVAQRYRETAPSRRAWQTSYFGTCPSYPAMPPLRTERGTRTS